MELYVTIATKHTCTCSCTWTHTHTLVLSPGPVLGYIWLLVIISPFVPFTAPVAVKKPSTPGCTSSQDKFNLEVPRADKTRRQHLGQGRGEEIWYLPQPSSSSSTYTYTPFYSSNLNPIHSTPTSTDKDILLALFSFFSVNQTDDSSRVEVEGMDNK